MQSITIKGTKRESLGKVATRALRNAGSVPCVIYGGNQEVIHFSADEREFKNIVYTPNVYTADVVLDGQSHLCIMQDIQFNPVTDRIMHVDFYQIQPSKEITMEIPIKIVGSSPGVLAGGVIRIVNRKLKVKSLVENLPDFIEVDISGMEIGNKLYVTKIKQENYKIMHPENTVVCQIRSSRAAMKAAQDATADAKK